MCLCRYSIDNNILQLPMPLLDSTVTLLSYTTNKVAESILSDDLEYLLTVELQTDAAVLGRFAERHGQPIVRVYSVRDAILLSTIRPNSKGPLASVTMSPTNDHVAIVGGDMFHTLTIWQRRHSDWTGGAFIIARQLIGNDFSPNSIRYTPWADVPLFLQQNNTFDQDFIGSQRALSRKWQFWSYGPHNLSPVHTMIGVKEEHAKSATGISEMKQGQQIFAINALGSGDDRFMRALLGLSWTCVTSFGGHLMIGTECGALLQITLTASRIHSSSDVILNGTIEEIGAHGAKDIAPLVQMQDASSSQRTSHNHNIDMNAETTDYLHLFASSICTLSECNRSWLVVR